MTRERIEDFREIVLPFVKKRLLETNYEGLGEADAKEFEKNFNEILNLANKALEQDPCGDCISRTEAIKCLECDFNITGKENMKTVVNYINSVHNKIVNLPSVKQEPTTNNDLGVDTISRADARSLICNIDIKYHLSGMSRKAFKDLYNGIDELPQATPQEPRWIPVSERLPKPNANDGLTARYYLIRNEYEDMLVARYDGMGWTQMYQHEYLEDDVIAWMPLPKAY